MIRVFENDRHSTYSEEIILLKLLKNPPFILIKGGLANLFFWI